MSDRAVVVLGGTGFVGSRLLELWAEDAEQRLIAPTHADLDVLDADALAGFLRQTDAPTVVNLAAWADVDGAEAQRDDPHGRVYALNVTFPARLARLCGELGKHLVHVSTDYVFDGTQAGRAYVEGDPTHALCWYAQTKLAGEHGVLDSGASVCVARIEMPFSAASFPRLDVARVFLRRLEAGQPIQGVHDQRITPVFLDDAVRALRLLNQAQVTGRVHVAASEWTTPYRFARSIAERVGLDVDLVQATDFETFTATRPARRPQHSWLDVSLFSELFGANVLRSVDLELDTWVEQLRQQPGRPQLPTARARTMR